MEWVHVSDLVAGRHLDPDFLPRILAYVEAKATYEALSKVMQLLYEARARNMVSEKLVDIVADWLSEVEAEDRVKAELVGLLVQGSQEEGRGQSQEGGEASREQGTAKTPRNKRCLVMKFFMLPASSSMLLRRGFLGTLLDLSLGISTLIL